MARTPVSRTARRLADGREIIYFDDEPGQDRSAADRRDLPPVATTAEARFDPLFGEWVGVAGHRQTRTFLPPASECPLCPSTAERSSEVPAPDYHVAVFENRFPSFASPGAPVSSTESFLARPGAGRCEVVCFTADHKAHFADLPVERVRTVVEAWADRTAELGRLPEVESVFVFENRGQEIGVTLAHPHGQIYGYPFVPPRTAQMARSMREHHERTGRCLVCEQRDAELAADRVVLQGAHWVAYVPFAARWPFEVHVVPKRHVADLPALDAAERDDLAEVYLQVLRRLDGVLGMPMPYIAAWHQAPVRTERDTFHAFAQVFSLRRAADKLKYLAGSESGAGAWINDIRPEDAARRLRDVG